MHKRAVAAVILLGLVVLTTVGILVSQQEPTPQPAPTPVAPTQNTLLVQVRDPSLLALGSVIVGTDEEKRLSQLFWTADWWVDQQGVAEISAAELGRKPVPEVIRTLQSQTQLEVDNAWVLDRLAFAGLVDAVGGVRIDLRRPTAYLNDRGVPVLLDKGINTMAGAAAADFVLDPSLKDERQRVRRFQAVWDQVLRRFPTDQEKARTLIVSLGALSKATMTTEELAAFLGRAHGLRVVGAYAEAMVPLDETNSMRVKPAQGVKRAYALDQLRMPVRVARVFPQFPTLESPVARVQAATPRSATVEQVRNSLLSRSWETAWAGRTDTQVSAAQVSPDVPEAAVVGLEQALGTAPQVQRIPWGDALVLLEPAPLESVTP